MKDKFNYIDFLMYVLPGSFLVIVLLLSLWSLNPELLKGATGNAFFAVAFILISFVFGNFIQTVSHKVPEARLKKKYWNGYYPSQIMFFPKNPVINESGREDLLNACVKAGLLTPEEKALFDVENNNFPKDAVDKANNIFDYIRVHFDITGKAERIRGAEGYYLFYRGMFVACFWATISFMAIAVLFPFRYYIPNVFTPLLGEHPSVFIGLVMPVIETALCLYFWRTFRYRARGAGQGFAREVYRAFCASALLKETEDDIQSNQE